MSLDDTFWKGLLDKFYSRTAVIALARTGAAAIGAAIIAFLATRIGIQLPEGTDTWLEALLFAVLTGGWNALVIWLEQNVNYRFGWLLLVARSPEYEGQAEGGTDAAVAEALAENDAYWLAVVNDLTQGTEGGSK